MKEAIQLITIIAMGGYILFLTQMEIPTLETKITIAENSSNHKVEELGSELAEAWLLLKEGNESEEKTIAEETDPEPHGLSEGEYRRRTESNRAKYDSLKMGIESKIRELEESSKRGRKALDVASSVHSRALFEESRYRKGARGIQKSQAQLRINSNSALAKVTEIRRAIDKIDLAIKGHENTLRELDIQYRRATRSLDLELGK